jgi:hypothetical protein
LNLWNVRKLPTLEILLHALKPNKSLGVWDTTAILFLAKRKAFCWRCGGSTRIAGGPEQHFCWRH